MTNEELKAAGIDLADLSQWKTIKRLAYDNQQFTYDQLRLLVGQRQYNGLERFCKRVGKPMYIHQSGFAWWIANRGV